MLPAGFSSLAQLRAAVGPCVSVSSFRCTALILRNRGTDSFRDHTICHIHLFQAGVELSRPRGLYGRD